MIKNLNSFFKKGIIAASMLAIAGSAYAQNLNAPIIPPTSGGSNSSIGASLQNVVAGFKNISTGVYSSLMVVALIAFSFGVIKTLISSKPQDKADGLKSIGFGIIALFALVGVWGLVSFLSANLGIGVGGDIPTPGVPTGVRTY